MRRLRGAARGGARGRCAALFHDLITGHIVVGLLVWTDRTYAPPIWVLSVIFLPLTAVMCLALLRPIKGATLGLMLKLGLMKPDDE